MYYPYFIAYMAAGFVISILVFFWALNNGQFNDQQRARFIPLQDDLETAPIKASRRVRIEIYALFTLAAIGLLTSAAVVVFALYKAFR
jgi:cbb3-type cytochrome oxidase maturation protein